MNDYNIYNIYNNDYSDPQVSSILEQLLKTSGMSIRHDVLSIGVGVFVITDWSVQRTPLSSNVGNR